MAAPLPLPSLSVASQDSFSQPSYAAGSSGAEPIIIDFWRLAREKRHATAALVVTVSYDCDTLARGLGVVRTSQETPIARWWLQN